MDLHPKTKLISSGAHGLGLRQNFPFSTGDAVFWSVNSAELAKFHVWTATGGAKEIVSFGVDRTRGVSDLGTDGANLVWIEGAGLRDAGSFPSLSIMTAEYTTDPAKIRPRRLRSEFHEVFGGFPFKVGCGYAARRTEQGGAWYLRITRLSDGVSWLLSRGTSWGWGDPVAVTCSEVFMYATTATTDTIARVRLDALGPGLPPD